MFDPIIAGDLGARPAFVVTTGTENAPVLLAVRRFSRWDAKAILATIDEWLEQWPRATICVEATFTEKRWRKQYLADVGRKQEAQAGFLVGHYFGQVEVCRVPPCYGLEPWVAWVQFGRPEEGEGDAGEHVRDALAVALKKLIRQGTQAGRPAVAEAMGGKVA